MSVGFGLTDSQYQANTPFESVCDRSWAVSWECHISALASAPGTPIHYHVRTPRVVCASGSPADFDRYGHGHGLGLGVTLCGVCPVVVVCTEGTLFPEWADTHTHTRTASFRALDHTGFVTTGPILIRVPFWNKNVWELPL